MSELAKILRSFKDGEITQQEAELRIKTQPFNDLGFAKVDTQRRIRQGSAEVIYGAGKTPEQIIGIIKSMIGSSQKTVMVTRLSPENAEEIKKQIDITYDRISKIAYTGEKAEPDGLGKIVIATGGTSDIPVAEEAALTAEILGNEVTRLYDIGVAGIHRLLSNKEAIMSASVIIAVAGMEGALASVVGGLADCPVIAVPTSVGYGASFGGLSALLSMLNSCASGVSVVNIDNGFGAGFLASRINHMEAKR